MCMYAWNQGFIVLGIYNVWNRSPGINHPLVGNGVCNVETNIDRPVHVHLPKFIPIFSWLDPYFFLIYPNFYPNLIYLDWKAWATPLLVMGSVRGLFPLCNLVFCIVRGFACTFGQGKVRYRSELFWDKLIFCQKCW